MDQAVVLGAKHDLLSEPPVDPGAKENGEGAATVIGVEADLSTHDWQAKLMDAGFDRNLPSAWILEGLTM